MVQLLQDCFCVLDPWRTFRKHFLLFILLLCTVEIFILTFISTPFGVSPAKKGRFPGDKREASTEGKVDVAETVDPESLSEQAELRKSACQIPDFSPGGVNGIAYKLNEINVSGISCIDSPHLLFEVDYEHNLVRRNPELISWNASECYFRELTRNRQTRTRYKIVAWKTKLPPNVTHIHVWCTRTHQRFTPMKVYEDYFSCVTRPSGRIKLSQKKIPDFSVLLLGIDSVSRLNFLRYMPESYRFLRDELAALDFRALNTHGFATRDSLIPLYTGMTFSQYRESCLSMNFDTAKCNKFIWDDFMKRGYVTSYDEDALAQHSLFNLQKLQNQNFNVDFRIPGALLEHVKIGHVPRNWEFFNRTNPCYGSRLSFQVVLENMQRMAWAYREHPHLAIGWSNGITHDENYFAKFGDQPILSMLKFMKDNKFLEKTLLFLFSDHGMRHGKFRQEGGFQAWEEEKLPMFFLVMPDKFKQDFPVAWQNMKENQDKLVTTRDIHQTLLDILDLSQLKNDRIFSRSKKIQGIPKFKQSLFLPVSPGRDCRNMEIPPSYCACMLKPRVMNVTLEFLDLAKDLVRQINGELHRFAKSECEELELVAITQVNEFETRMSVGFKELIVQTSYEITFETMPGNGEFFVHFLNFKHPVKDLQDIHRISTYGMLGGKCVSMQRLRPFCACRNMTHVTLGNQRESFDNGGIDRE